MKKIISIILLLLSVAATTKAAVTNNNHVNFPDSTLRPYLIAFVAENVEKTAAWYKEKLNFEIIRKLDFPAFDSLKIIHMKYGNSEVELELIQKKSSFSIKKYVPDYDGFDKAPMIGFSKIAFEVKDAETIAKKLKTMGVKFLVNLYDDKEWGLRSFIVEDIDGNVLQFNQKR